MGKLYIIRHGQASFLSADYDNLSPLGARQSEALADYWVRQEIVPTRVVLGPRRRHRQTYEAFAAILDKHTTLPEPEDMAEFDEFDADSVMRVGVRTIVPQATELHAAVAEFQNPDGDRHRGFQQVFEHVTRKWVRGEFEPEGAEPFQAFRQRVDTGLTNLMSQSDKGETIAVFTSGGPVAASTGHLLDIDDEKTLELSWMVRNGAYNEILFSGDRKSLLSFANVAHLNDPELLTFR